MTTAWTAFQIWTKCSHLGPHTSRSPSPSFISQLYRLHENETRAGFGTYWEYLYQRSDSTPRESSSESPSWKTNKDFQPPVQLLSQNILCAEKQLFWTINTVKIWKNSHSYPKKNQIFLRNISTNLGSWWDSIQSEPKISALAGETCCYIFLPMICTKGNWEREPNPAHSYPNEAQKELSELMRLLSIFLLRAENPQRAVPSTSCLIFQLHAGIMGIIHISLNPLYLQNVPPSKETWN